MPEKGTEVRPRPSYGVREVAGLLGLTGAQIRRFVRAGLLQPERGARAELRFSFQDLAFLRLVKRLSATRIPPRRMHRALRRLREQLPPHAPLSGVHLDADGDQVVVRQRGRLWDAESGQHLFDFSDPEDGLDVVEFPERAPGETFEVAMDAADWYRLGCELHEEEPERAREAYQRALGLEPAFPDVHVNLGCLHHALGKLEDAEAAYRVALELRPDDSVAAFDLGVVLEDQGRPSDAREAYESALAFDPGCADAHYNLARLHDRQGDAAAAVRHLQAYRRLTQDE